MFFCRPRSLQTKAYLFFLGHAFVLSLFPATSVTSQPPLTVTPRLCIMCPLLRCSLPLPFLSAHEHVPTSFTTTLPLAGSPFCLPHASVFGPPLPHKASRRTGREQRSRCSGQEVQSIIQHQPLPLLCKSTAACYMGLGVREEHMHCKKSLPQSAAENAYHSKLVCSQCAP